MSTVATPQSTTSSLTKMASTTTQEQQSSVFKSVAPFVRGGMAGMLATSCIQPIDMIKVRIQLAGESAAVTNPFKIAANIVRNEGIPTFYKGLSAGLLRQATYTTARMGIFRKVTDKIKDPVTGQLTFAKRATAGLVAGGLGSIIGNPCDLALIRMQADSLLPAAERRGYTNVGNALSTIVRQEGVLGLWRGCAPTIARAMALNVGMLATYDQAKEVLTAKMGQGKTTNFASSAVAGFFASFLSLPFDFIKTRMQKMSPLADGTMPYKGSLDCAMKVARTEGPLAFYAGFPTFYFRIAPHAMITLMAVEYLSQWLN